MSPAEQIVRNKILNRLPEHELTAVLAVAEFVQVELREVIIKVNRPIMRVDFVESGMYSMLAVVEADQVETATVGLEGFVGIPLVLGDNSTSVRVFCQVEASAWRIDSAQFKILLSSCKELDRLCKRYALFLFDQTSQNLACNLTHAIEERTAKWLLLTQDRVAADQFELTQELLGQMVGVRRQGVNVAAGLLHTKGAIDYSRGKLNILNRSELEQASCECYQIINTSLERYLS